jgi:hypothetical protein
LQWSKNDVSSDKYWWDSLAPALHVSAASGSLVSLVGLRRLLVCIEVKSEQRIGWFRVSSEPLVRLHPLQTPSQGVSGTTLTLTSWVIYV